MVSGTVTMVSFQEKWSSKCLNAAVCSNRCDQGFHAEFAGLSSGSCGILRLFICVVWNLAADGTCFISLSPLLLKGFAGKTQSYKRQHWHCLVTCHLLNNDISFLSVCELGHQKADVWTLPMPLTARWHINRYLNTQLFHHSKDMIQLQQRRKNVFVA